MVVAVGTKAPEFTLIDQFGEEVTLSEALKESPVALVFFPLAFSGVCHGELCELRDNIEMFRDSKVQLMGVSVDSKFSLRAWSDAENYNFQLLADFWPHGGVAKEYGVFIEERGIATRATVLIGQDGNVAASFENSPSEARPLEAYREALAQL